MRRFVPVGFGGRLWGLGAALLTGLVPGALWGQWAACGRGQCITSGNVGIGTTSPTGIKTEIANGGSPYDLHLSGFAPSLYFGRVSRIFPNGGSGQTAAAYIGFSTITGIMDCRRGIL